MAVDLVTGLAWQRVVTGNESRWTSAAAYCATLTLGGESGWRVPSALELSSIVDFAAANPAIDGTTFPNTPAIWFVTSTGVYMYGRRIGGEYYWWTLDFKTGLTLNGMPPSGGSVRCVRTGTPRRCYPADGRFEATSASGVEAVVDAATTLTWQKGSSPAALTWADASAYCTSLGGGFRLPGAKELLSLVVWKGVPVGVGVPIDGTAFPATPAASFWTSSRVAGSATDAVTVSFKLDAYTGTSSAPTSSEQYVRCVR